MTTYIKKINLLDGSDEAKEIAKALIDDLGCKDFADLLEKYEGNEILDEWGLVAVDRKNPANEWWQCVNDHEQNVDCGTLHDLEDTCDNWQTWGARFGWDWNEMDRYDAGGLDPYEPCTDAEWDRFVESIRTCYGDDCDLLKTEEE